MNIIFKIKHKIRNKALSVLSRMIFDSSNEHGFGEDIAFKSLSTIAALKRIRNRNVPIQTVIDIGASDGRWSKDAQRIFSDANYLLIEAQKEHGNALEKHKKSDPKIDYVICAAGNRKGEIYFDNSDLFGGLAMEEKPLEGDFSILSVDTVDNLVSFRNLPGPYLLKLDTHGFEVPIFEGASEVLKKANLIVVEVYNFHITPNSLLFYEMCEHLSQKGFRCVDVSEPIYRKKDKVLWQMDFFFEPKSSSVFETNSFD
jgi:FkbM family methyltransferase